MPEAKLSKDLQLFVVKELACFTRSVDVQAALKEYFDIEISLPALSYYKLENPNLPQKLRTTAKRTRTTYLKKTIDIPIANKSFRLTKLQQLFNFQESSKLPNTVLMQSLLEQAAKESGDAYTNKQKHEHTGKDGKDLGPQKITVNIVKSREIITDETEEK